MDNAAIEEIFETLGPVKIRRMFGGKGIYFDGIILALEVNGEILLKGDAESAPALEEAGARQWAYEGKGKPVKMPYWSIPEPAWDDPDEMARWVGLAYEAALRSKKERLSSRVSGERPHRICRKAG
ncbi:competence protein TfoX [Sinorhizobium meliloti]|nr:competence protein TfoX [Sinorhizobium meliloti]MDX0079036.1 competence protein TfoX [Sinorhizobium meliloti]